MDYLIIYDKFDMNWSNPVAVLKNTFETKITEKLNGEYHLTFNTIIDDKSSYIKEENYVEVKEEIFIIKEIIKDRNINDDVILNVKCEHVFYEMLDDYVEEARSHLTTPAEIINKLNLYTDFNLECDSLLHSYERKNCTISRGSPIKTINRVLEKWNVEIYRNRRNVVIKPFLNIDKIQLFKHKKNIETLKRTGSSQSITTRLFLIGREGLSIEGLDINSSHFYFETDSNNITTFFNNDIDRVIKFRAETELLDGKRVFKNKYIDSKYINDYPKIKNDEVLKDDIEDPLELLLMGSEELSKIESVLENFEISVAELKHIKGDLERFGLGYSVLVQDKEILDNKDSGIIQARIVEYEYYPFEHEKSSTVKIGYFNDNVLDFLSELKKAKEKVSESAVNWDKILDMIGKDGTISTEWLNNRIKEAGDMIKFGQGHMVVDNRGLMILDTDNIDTAKAIIILTTSEDLKTGKVTPIMGLAQRSSTFEEFEYRTAVSSSGIHADEITTGKIKTGLVSIVGNADIPNAFIWNEEGIRVHEINKDNTINADKFILWDNEGFKFSLTGGTSYEISLTFKEGLQIGEHILGDYAKKEDLDLIEGKFDGVVMQDELYNHVKISKEKGIQIIDRGQRERVRIGNYKQGKYGMIISDKSGSTTVLDEDGIMQTWQEGNVDNVSEIKPLVLYVHIPKHTSIIHKAILRFKREAFRAYSKSTTTQPSATQTSSGGGAVLDTTSTTATETRTTWGGKDVVWRTFRTSSAGDPSHSHEFERVHGHSHDFEIPSHNHEINIPEHSHDVEIPEHSHDMVYGIFEDIVADNITISINSRDYTSFLGAKNGAFNSDEEDLDITTLLEIGKWNRVEIGSGNLGRIDATIFLQTFMQTIRKSVILDEGYIDNGVIGFGTNLGDVSLSGQRISHKSNIDRVYKADIVRGTANLSFLDWNKQVEGWKHLYVIGENVDGVSVCLDGTWEFDYEEQRYFLETEDTPWMFWIVGGTLYKQYGTDETTRKVLAESVKKVASIRGWSNFAFPENDHGLVVGYIKNDGRVYYRNYAMQSNGLKRWEEEKLVSGFVGVAKDLNLFTTNDYRLGFTVENISEYISWHITDRNWAGMAIAPEKITGGIGNILVDLVKFVHRYSSVNEKINIGINTTVDFLYAKSDNKFESIVNIPDETMNYGRFIRFKVKYDVKNIVFSDFYLRDSLGNTFNAISIEKTGDKIYVAEIMNFNNARGTVALVFKGGIDKNESGGNMDSFEGLFTPTGLVPVFLPAPKVVAIRNVEVIE